MTLQREYGFMCTWPSIQCWMSGKALELSELSCTVILIRQTCLHKSLCLMDLCYYWTDLLCNNLRLEPVIVKTNKSENKHREYNTLY